MKKGLKKCISVLLLLLIFVMGNAVWAEQESNITLSVGYDRPSGTVTVSGIATDVTNTEEAVRLMILKPDTNIDSLAAGTTTFNVCGIHMDETKMNSDKTFTFASVVLPDTLPKGDYIVRVAAGNSAESTFLFLATEEQALDSMDNVTDSDEIIKLINKYNDVYGLDLTESGGYGKLSDTGKEYVATHMCGIDYEGDAQNIKKNFELYTLLYTMYEGTWGDISAAINTNAGVLGIDKTEYNKLSPNAQISVCKALEGQLFESRDLFITAFNNAVTLNASQSAGVGSSHTGSRGDGVSMEVKVSEEKSTPAPSDNNGVFSDLDGFGWAEESITLLYKKNIINGKGDGIFAPADFVTRAEAVKMILLAFAEVDESAVCGFSDVAEDTWMYPYIATAVKLGFVTGYNENSFGAYDKVTREDFSVMLCRAAESKGFTFDTSDYKFSDDENIAQYAKDAVYKLYNAEIINGMGDNYFMPKAYTQRAQAAKMIAAKLRNDK